MASIQCTFVLDFTSDGNLTEEQMDSVLRDQARDQALALGRQFDTTTISTGVVTSSISGTETFAS